jgi:hypothetical protein
MSGVFDNVVVAGIPLLVMVIGLVQFVKSFGLTGNVVKGVSLGIGLLLGVGYQLSISMPADFAGWFAVTVFGLGLGLVASGIYDAAKP